MIDRLEELLDALEDEEERESGAELRPEKAVPARSAPEHGGKETGTPEEETGETAGAQREWKAPEEHRQEQKRDEQARQAQEAENGADEDGLAEERLEGPLWNGTAWSAVRREKIVELPQPETGGGLTAEPPEGAEERTAAAEWSLEGLYRKTVQAGRPGVQAAPAEPAAPAVRGTEPGRTAPLTVDELDRAVRRDSRRYDGGISIY